MDFYKVIKSIFDDISSELEFEKPYEPGILLNEKNPYHYVFRRGLIESLYNGTDGANACSESNARHTIF